MNNIINEITKIDCHKWNIEQTKEARFTASNSMITTNKGDTLYITNTTATINLTNNKIINNDKISGEIVILMEEMLLLI